MVDINDSTLSAQGFGCYEQHRVLGDMNDLGFHDLKPLDTKNISRLWMIWPVLCHELRVMDYLNDSTS